MLSGLFKEEAELLEQQYIILFDSYRNGYNSTLGGEVGSKGNKLSKEVLKRMSEMQKGRKHSKEQCKLMSEIQKCKRPIICLETGEIYDTPDDCASDLRIDRKYIISVCRNSQHTTGGFHFQYADVEHKSIEEIESKRKTKKKAVVCLETNERFDSVCECAEKIGARHQDVSTAIKHHITTKGLHFKFETEDITLESIKEKHDSFSSNKVKCIETGKIYSNITECAKEFGVANSNIYSVCSGKNNSLHGFHFRFVDYKPRIRKVICTDTGDIFDNMGQCAEFYNINVRKLSYVLRNGNGEINNMTFAFC